ncbi:MAG: HisA/HisF-related TIM barrel protein [Terriglobia bacterium]
MIIPCIDLLDGKVVQLIQGKEKFLELPDAVAVLGKFAAYPEIQVIDLDAAMGKERNNAQIVQELCARKPCRVGGGIRSVASGINEDFLRALVAAVPREKILIAVDSLAERVAIHGWRDILPLTSAEAIPLLEPYCSGFLCTYVDAEGRLQGTNLEWFRSLRAATQLPITAAGGITTDEEIAALEKLGMSAALGMAIYRKVFPEFFAGRAPDRH